MLESVCPSYQNPVEYLIELAETGGEMAGEFSVTDGTNGKCNNLTEESESLNKNISSCARLHNNNIFQSKLLRKEVL